MDVLANRVLVGSSLGLDSEGVGTEVVTLGLQQVGRQVLSAVTVEPRQSSGEGWGWDTELSSLGNNVSPAGLGLVDSLVEEVIEQQVLEIGVVAVSAGDVLQENGSDNATAAPHQGNGGLVQLPAVLLGSLQTKIISMNPHCD